MLFELLEFAGFTRVICGTVHHSIAPRRDADNIRYRSPHCHSLSLYNPFNKLDGPIRILTVSYVSHGIEPDTGRRLECELVSPSLSSE